jgi:inosose dehydratase
MKTHRRNFLKITGLGALAAALPRTSNASPQAGRVEMKTAPFRLGIASYSLRKFGIDDVLKMTERLGIKAISFKDMHLPLESTREQIQPVIKMFADEGIEVYGGGVIYMASREEADQAFEYARMAGMKMIIGVPDHELIPYVEQKVKKYNIRLAIHNHGPQDKRYPSPASAYERIRDLDPRMGLCIDIGHTARLGLDPSEEIEKYFPRVFDIHIKDETEARAEGQTCIMGLGIIDIPRMIRTLVDMEYSQTTALEFEAEENDPLPGMARSIGYVQGVASALGYKLA